ncbi:helix-turn-helix transcriptional regulator [Paractinoplanes toevensis]|uniref:LuxR family transcriptional regulator n=1 Tax=Paractinoplanes toevensis TaxID=571911 RepID=A0A919TAI3_9ACTN|nr:LuxR family transcriptional regulator [Actinoplanes toevensis]GIM91995.1 LuxR family transcriptional regulator [Actinoplanes toevensis]
MSSRAGRRTRLRGRADECAVLDDLVSSTRRGESRSLVVRGEAGIGKTALLGHLVESASDLLVVRAAGVESEMELAYAGLHQLCGPLLDRLDRLPDPQRQSLEIVFGLRPGPAPDRFLIGLAVLSLFTAVAEQRPLLCVVDDAQWLDVTSGLTLAFVARRLLAEPVGMVFAARESGDVLGHLPELAVRGIGDADARALLRSAVRVKLDEAVQDRIVAETGGNPLALLQLPQGLSAAQLAGGFDVLGGQALTWRIQESFVRRLELLSDAGRRLLLVAAAEPAGDPLLLWRAAERLGIAPAAADTAQAEGLLTIGERVTFHHPLARSAIYRSAAAADRRAAHRVLAEVTDPDVDPDRRAWHLAAAAAGPDEKVATELERAAGRARERGGLAAAAMFLVRAVAMTNEPDRRADRALAAAQAGCQADELDAALGLVALAEAGPLTDVQSAVACRIRAHVALSAGRWTDALPLLREAAARLAPIDVELAREIYLTAWGAAGMADDLAARDVIVEICQGVRSLPPPTGTAHPRDLLLDGFAQLIIEGCTVAAPALRRAADALTGMPAEDILRWGWMAVGARAALWDGDGWYRIAERNLRVARDAGELAALPSHLTYLAMAVAWNGDFAATESLIAELDGVTAATGARLPPYALLRLRALQGRDDEVAAAVEGFGGDAVRVRWAIAVLNNGLARYPQAVSAARPAASAAALNHWVFGWMLPELVEAAVRAGDLGLARDAYRRLDEATRPFDGDFPLGIRARSRALLGGPSADGLYREAIERLSRTPLRPEAARARLLYGEWLRRENRPADARDQLRTAHEMLTAIGMEAFAERARAELAATGEHVRKRSAGTHDELTAQERQIAQLARDGLSNPEIGTRLFLSSRTVEWHLRNVFTKLGIRSRRDLAGVLPGR